MYTQKMASVQLSLPMTSETKN